MADHEHKTPDPRPSDNAAGDAIAAPPQKNTGLKTTLTIHPVLQVALLLMIAFVVMLILLPNGMINEPKSPVSRALADMRTVAAGLEAYYADHHSYPPWTPGDMAASHIPGFGSPPASVPTLALFFANPTTNTVNPYALLTTPVAYISCYLRDACSPTKGPFGYYSKKGGWILFSAGPDGVYDLTLSALERLYDYRVAQPTLTLIVRYACDPSNGTRSSGDIFRVKQ